VFDRMHVADQRHGLDVVGALRERGVIDRDVLVAGLIHDAGKGDTGVVPRVIHSLGEVSDGRISAIAARVPRLASPLARLRDHAELSAQLAAQAGCSDRTIELIRHQDDPRDPEYGEALRAADEAH
jgi:hypothetical protein